MSVLVKPLVTEKVTKENENSVFGFIVSRDANKVQIKNEIQKTYNVTVESVRTMRYAGKKKVRYTKSGVLAGKTQSFKKAIVKVAAGEVIDIYSGI
ncbi:MAG: 50S ribosomal protein L23 [Cytophagales bacterium]|jgi:large subunit ribosomal protein L23